MDFSYIDDWAEEEGAGLEIAPPGEGYRNIWVIAEAAEQALHPATLEAMGQARELADQIGVYVYALILGEGIQPLGHQLVALGADAVLIADHPALIPYQPIFYVNTTACLVDQYRPEILLLPGTELGNDLAPRLAQRLNTGLISHCIGLGLDMAERLLLGTFPVLGGEMYNTVSCPEGRPQMATLEPGHFPLPYEDPYRSGDIQSVDLDLSKSDADHLTWAAPESAPDLPPVPLSRAKVVVCAGRGMGDHNGYTLVEQLARALGGAVAGSRGAYDEGWIAEEQIVGIGGKSIAPDLYIACGLSGDIYHYFGARQAKFVVAINSDREAPIMKIANVAVVGDARQVIPAMLDALAS